MENTEFIFNVELAGVTARIHCKNQDNYSLFLPYLTEKEEAFSVQITDNDIQYSIKRLIQCFGEPTHPYSECFLENMSILNVLSKKLLDYNVLTIHGSALCMDGEAYIFIAPAGTGKSTHARFWRETFGDHVWMINDDRPMVRIEDGIATAYGTPWNGKHHLGTNASVPLKAVIWLTRDTVNHIEPMRKADAFPVLMAQTAWSRTGDQKPRTLQLESELLNAVDFYKLGCNLNSDAAKVAWNGMQN